MGKRRKKKKSVTFRTLMLCFFVMSFVFCLFFFIENTLATNRTLRRNCRTNEALAEKMFDSTGAYLGCYERLSEVLVDEDILTEERMAMTNDPDDADFGLRSFRARLSFAYQTALGSPFSVAYLYMKDTGVTFSMHGGPDEGDPVLKGEITDMLGLTEDLWAALCGAGEHLVTQIQKTENMTFYRLFMAREITPGAVLIVGLAEEPLLNQLSYSYLPEDSVTVLLTQNGQKITLREGNADQETPDDNDRMTQQLKTDVLHEESIPEKGSDVRNTETEITFGAVTPGTVSETADGRSTANPEKESARDTYGLSAGNDAVNGTTVRVSGTEYFWYSRYMLDDTFREVVLIPDTIHPESRRRILLDALTALLVWLAGGGLLSYGLASVLYRPVGELMNALPLTTEERKSSSEFRLIDDAVNRLDTQKNDYQARAARSEGLLAASLFNRIASGELALSDEVLVALRQGGVPTAGRRERFIYVSVTAAGEGSEVATDVSVLSEFHVLDRFTAYFRELGFEAFFAFRGDSDYTGLVEIPEGNADTHTGAENGPDDEPGERAKSVRKAILHMTDMFPEEFPFLFSIGVSEEFSDLSDLSAAAKQAQGAVDVLYMNEQDGGVCFWEDMNRQAHSDEGRKFIDGVHRLSAAITMADFESAEEMIDPLCGQISRSLAAGSEEAADQMNVLSGALCLTFRTLPSPMDSLAGKATALFDLHGRDLRRRQSSIQAGLHDLMQEAKALQTQSSDPQGENRVSAAGVKRYIQEHYSDQDLSAGKVADQFGITPVWLSVMFKKEAGIGFLDYVQKVRIEQIKKLLRETDLTVSQIAQQTGYTSAATLTRVYKRYEGVTPGWYRKNRDSLPAEREKSV